MNTQHVGLIKRGRMAIKRQVKRAFRSLRGVYNLVEFKFAGTMLKCLWVFGVRQSNMEGKLACINVRFVNHTTIKYLSKRVFLALIQGSMQINYHL